MKKVLQFWQLARFYRQETAIGSSLISHIRINSHYGAHPTFRHVQYGGTPTFDRDGSRSMAVNISSCSWQPDHEGLRRRLLPQSLAARPFSSETAGPAGAVSSISHHEDPRHQYRFLAEALVDLGEEYDARVESGDHPTDVSKLVVFDQKDSLAQWINGVILECTFIEDCNDRKKMLKDILDGFASKDEYLRRLFNFHLSVHLSVLSFCGSMMEKEEFRKRVENIPKVISELTVLLTKDNELSLRALVVTDVLWKLIMKNRSCRNKIVEVPEILDRLLGLLSHEEFPQLQSNAAVGLTTLVKDDPEIGRRIVNTPGAVSKIVKLLTEDVDPSSPLHSNAASLLEILSQDNESRKQILKCPKTLVQLVGLLSPEKNPKLLSNVAHLLGSLAEGNGEARRDIAEIPGELMKTVFLLSKLQDDSPGLRLWMNATGTLSESIKDGKLRGMIEKWPDAAERLMDLLFRDESPEIRSIVATTLCHLSKESEEVAKRIGEIPNVIPQLLELILARDGDSHVTVAMVQVLQKLVENPDHRMKILEYPEVVDRLMGLLSRDEDSPLQIHVLELMVHLSKEKDEVRRRVGQIADV
ncbi:hypothetical protein R1flu_025356 [Riccia fluitans]|uniref:Vacuolar protein 8 n=1 Tax=Riccia fluitans TaxID=41844 RepID=A0ABD1XXX5_9MARC